MFRQSKIKFSMGPVKIKKIDLMNVIMYRFFFEW